MIKRKRIQSFALWMLEHADELQRMYELAAMTLKDAYGADFAVPDTFEDFCSFVYELS